MFVSLQLPTRLLMSPLFFQVVLEEMKMNRLEVPEERHLYPRSYLPSTSVMCQSCRIWLVETCTIHNFSKRALPTVLATKTATLFRHKQCNKDSHKHERRQQR